VKLREVSFLENSNSNPSPPSSSSSLSVFAVDLINLDASPTSQNDGTDQGDKAVTQFYSRLNSIQI